MNNPLRGKRPGSKAWRELSRDGRNIGLRDADGMLIPNGRVGIDFICKRGHTKLVIGSVRISTRPHADRQVWALPLGHTVDGAEILPMEDLPDGQAKLLLLCPLCGSDTRISTKRLEGMVTALWDEEGRQVNLVKIVTRDVASLGPTSS